MAGPSTGEKARSTIVIKRIKKGGHAHHGGAWKIAYADFVTAMMAFFLLMWLLGSTTKGDLKGISDYFQSPLQVALAGGSGSGDATSLVPGGGDDLSRSVGQKKRGMNDAERRRRAEVARQDRQKLDELKAKLEAAIRANPKLAEFRDQIRIEITVDGLRIQIVDDFNRPMFDLGGATVKPYMREILSDIGLLLNEVDNRVVLTGHTDATPYAAGPRGYSNWELSAERANASRRELIGGGMRADKVVRVVGLGESSPLLPDQPFNPLNRRISIIVLNKLAEERLAKADAVVDAADAAAAESVDDGVGGEAPTAAAAARP